MNQMFLKPIRNKDVEWIELGGEVELIVKNRGVYNAVFQLLLNKPKLTHIHLDETGSYIWKKIDGEKTVFEIGVDLEKEFSDKVSPLYERLIEFLCALNENKLIRF